MKVIRAPQICDSTFLTMTANFKGDCTGWKVIIQLGQNHTRTTSGEHPGRALRLQACHVRPAARSAMNAPLFFCESPFEPMHAPLASLDGAVSVAHGHTAHRMRL